MCCGANLISPAVVGCSRCDADGRHRVVLEASVPATRVLEYHGTRVPLYLGTQVPLYRAYRYCIGIDRIKNRDRSRKNTVAMATVFFLDLSTVPSCSCRACTAATIATAEQSTTAVKIKFARGRNTPSPPHRLLNDSRNHSDSEPWRRSGSGTLDPRARAGACSAARARGPTAPPRQLHP